MDFEVIPTTDGEVAVLSVTGELDLATNPVLASALDTAREAGHRDIVVDLANLAFLDSTGIGTLVSHAVAARERGGSLRVVNASGMPLRALQVTGVLEILTAPVDELDESPA